MAKDSKNRKTADCDENTHDLYEDFNPYGAWNKMFNNMNNAMPKMDQEALMASHRKNLETLNEANKMAVEVMRSIATLQGQFLRQSFDDMNTFARDVMTKKSSPEAGTEKLKKAVSKAMEHSSNVADIMLKSNQDLFKKIQNRFQEGVGEMESYFDKTGKKKTKH